MNLTKEKEVVENDVEKAVAELYSHSQRPKLRTSSAYVFSQLQKNGVRVSKQEVTDLFKRLHEKGVGVLHPGGFYRQKFDFKVNPRSIFKGVSSNGNEKDDVAEMGTMPSYNIRIENNEVSVSRTFPVTNQAELKKAIDTLMNLLTD